MVCSWVVAMAEEEDSRTIVTDLYFNDVTYLKYGDTFNGYEVQLTRPEGAVYHLGNSGRLFLEKYDETKGKWDGVEYPYTVKEGKYRYSTQVRIDETYGKTHRLPNNLEDINLYVDGVLCPQPSSTISVYESFSFGWIVLPEFEVNKVVSPLQWTGGTPNLGNLYVGNAIVSFDLG